jgi:erythronate-4-phosphate dehydrogenase
MKIVVDDKIPYIRGALEPYAAVVYMPGNRIDAKVTRDADALITRTRTRCDRQLLAGSSVSLIATATAGFDHIDTEYCVDHGIEWVNAPGCNAESVNQYLASALLGLAVDKGHSLPGKTIGIVGVGHVGSKVARTCEILGMRVLLNDPPRERKEGPGGFVALEKVQREADFVSFHVPLNRDGIDSTWHMVDRAFIGGFEKKPVLINTCRGEVFDSTALLPALDSGLLSGLVIDCWENEPTPEPALLDRVDIGTAHIAGYSRDGKANGTMQAVRAVSRFFKLGMDDWKPSDVERPENPVIELNGRNLPDEEVLARAVLATYDVRQDDRRLHQSPQKFEQLRGDYPVRREFGAFTIKADELRKSAVEKLKQLNFTINAA